MQYYTKEIRIAFFSLVASLFLLSGTHSSFSQESIPEISDEDLDLLEEFLEQAEELFEEENYEEAILYYDRVLAIDSTNVEALFAKSLVLESLGEEEESFSNLEKISIPELPEVEFRVPPENSENQAAVDEIVEGDQILFVIVGVFIVILIIIILLDYITRRRQNVSDVVTARQTKQTIFSKPSSDSDSNQKEDDFHPTSLDAATNLEVNQAMKILSNLRDMNMLDNPETAKQFLLMRGFSSNSVKNALLGMGIDPSYVTDL